MLIHPYAQGSGSARLLGQALGCKLVAINKRTTRTLETNSLINWGASNFSRNIRAGIVLNPPAAVKNATSKLRTFQLLKNAGINVPEWALDIEQAKDWVRRGNTVYGRDIEAGAGGRGITVYPSRITNPDSVRLHKFYTKYWPHENEYRFHAFKGIADVITQRKGKRADWVPPAAEDRYYGHYIRNTQNGYIFIRQNLNPNNLNLQAALAALQPALQALSLDFAAFDVLVQQGNKYCILEANTAPGIEGTTVQEYKQHLTQLLTH